MSYHTPELLLVGSAHNLVLGGIDRKLSGYNNDFPGVGAYSPDSEEPDNLGW